MPSIATLATNPRVTVREGRAMPYNFRACFIDPYQGEVASAFAFGELGARKAAILYDRNDAYSRGLALTFEAHFAKRGGTIVATQTYAERDTQFGASLERIKAATPDLVFMPGFFKEVALAVLQARDLGLSVPFMGGDGWPSKRLLSVGGNAVEGSYFVNHLDYDDPRLSDFTTKYLRRFDVFPKLSAFLGYDAGLMLIDAIQRSGRAEGESIAAALETTDIQGITGHIRIGKDTHNPENKDAAILKIEGGRFVFQGRWSGE